MRIEDRIIYADEGKVLDFATPHYVLNEDHEIIQNHLYSTQLHMGKKDKPENYIEVDASEVK